MKLRNGCFLAFSTAALLLLAGCDEDQNSSPAKPPVGRPGVSRATACLRSHPALQVRSFPDTARAVKAFALATMECQPTEEEMQAHAEWLDQQGVTIENNGAEQ